MGVWFLLLSALVAHAKAELTDVELKKIAEKELSASE